MIVTIILQTKVDEVDKKADGFYTMNSMFSGYAILAAGLTTGFANLACGCDSELSHQLREPYSRATAASTQATDAHLLYFAGHGFERRHPVAMQQPVAPECCVPHSKGLVFTTQANHAKA